MQKKGLGRGLESLIPGLSQGSGVPLLTQEDSAGQLQHIPVTKIIPNPNQPRKYFDEEAFTELVVSIKEHGLVQPIVVRQMGSLFELVVGERRWRAAKEAGLTSIPAIVRDTSDREALELALIENVQRQNLNAIEEATAYYHLIEDFDLTQEQVAERVGKSRSAVANTIRLLQLPGAVKDLIFEEKLSSGHARALLSLSSEELQVKFAERIIQDNLSVRQTESMVRLWRNPPQKKPTEPPPPYYKRAAKDLSDRFSTKVRIRTQGDKGKVEIHFESEAELRRLIAALTDEEVAAGISPEAHPF
ncbi:MAG TPA: ParB/RepB/Spo0J family partition protein [Anaerolineae bacterium]|nr:ParB/RepB/Spo0J family partition protein [Anaerolineae bacterium]